MSESLPLSLSPLVVPPPTKDESGLRTVLCWDVDSGNTAAIKAPDNKHMQRTAGANVGQCWVVLGRFGRDDLSPPRQQRGCGKVCTLSAPAGSAAMQGSNSEQLSVGQTAFYLPISLSSSISSHASLLPPLIAFIFNFCHSSPVCIPTISLSVMSLSHTHTDTHLKHWPCSGP